jgi:hypothetical protein
MMLILVIFVKSKLVVNAFYDWKRMSNKKRKVIKTVDKKEIVTEEIVGGEAIIDEEETEGENELVDSDESVDEEGNVDNESPDEDGTPSDEEDDDGYYLELYRNC